MQEHQEIRSPERRHQRSDDPWMALTFQLEHVRELYGLDDVVLASEDGLTVAYAGDVWRSYLLAAFAAEYASSDLPAQPESIESSFAPYYRAIEGSHISVISFEASHVPVHLCGVASQDNGVSKGLEHARHGIERILSA